MGNHDLPRPAHIRTIAWVNDALEILDQTLLPEKITVLRLERLDQAFEAIQQLRVRGAPLIGVTAAFGLYLGMRGCRLADRAEFFRVLKEQIAYLASARPTAVNLSWALEAAHRHLETSDVLEPGGLVDLLLRHANELLEDDRRRCAAMADHGQSVIPDRARILTHCNTGALATAGMGTALGVVFRAHQLGKQVQVYADETRPVLQGARLTVWELVTAGIPVRLICNGMAAALMKEGQVDLVIVGADRIAADGSVANKIGTYHLAIAARYHRVPFYVAAPGSTIDLRTATGADIPIELRNPAEIRNVLGRCPITAPEVECWNPAFDVTPPDLVTAIITEGGIVRPPYDSSLPRLVAALGAAT